ncbi:hypothetical protein SNEBB_006136 [Seison nebaliae]|nr:hypothetical protein SNEBB_006136 [Seison nebaliae]
MNQKKLLEVSSVSFTSLAYDKGDTSIPLTNETIGERFQKSCELYRTKDAIITKIDEKRYTYGDLWSATNRLAKSFLQIGLRNGDKVAIWSHNRYEWTVVQFACARIGVILVNLNPAYTKTELQHSLNDSEASILLYSDTFNGHDTCPLMMNIHKKSSNLAQTISLDNEWEDLLSLGTDIQDESLRKVEKICKCNDVANIQYTSGTTAPSKAVVLTHKNILNNALFTGLNMKFSTDEKICLPVPLFHAFSMVLGILSSTLYGSTIIMPSPQFDVASTIKSVFDERCTAIFGVPIMYLEQLTSPVFQSHYYSTVTKAIIAGSVIHEELLKRIVEEMDIRHIMNSYGSTENSPLVTQSDYDSPLSIQLTTVGRIQQHQEISIQSKEESGRIIERNKDGEVCVRGYSVMKEYFHDDEATTKSFDENNWYHTGDMGSMDTEGYIRISGRLTDIIKIHGKEIDVETIENKLLLIDQIKSVEVVGIPTEQPNHEEIMAFCILKEKISTNKLHEHCTRLLSANSIPKYWQFIEQFPLTTSGKVKKVELRRMGKEILQGK